MSDRKKEKVCKVRGCNEKHAARKYCRKHYRQFMTHGRILKRGKRDPNEIRLKKKFAEIILTDTYGEYKATAIIDREDAEKVKDYQWTWGKTAVQTKFKGKRISLAKFILGLDNSSLLALHKNGNFLDNRKCNIVIGTKQQRSINTKLPSNNTSGYKGVSWSRKSRKWSVSLVFNGKTYRGGFYEKKEDAIAARKELEAIYHKPLKF